jgi:hypothetical protein
MINSKPVPRRALSLATIEDAIAELGRIEAAEHRGSLRATGNWTPGQIMAHLAAWIEYGWEGYPMKSPPWVIRWAMKLILRRILRVGMTSGVRIPGVAGGTTGADAMETLAGIERLRSALRRLAAAEPVRFESPAFGPITQADRVRLQLRHAELHLSFLSLEEEVSGPRAN